MNSPAHPTHVPARAAHHAVRGGIIGNYVDQFDIFVPVIALAPAADTLFGNRGLVFHAGLIFVATLLGRPLGALIFGPLADRLGRARIAKIALLGVAITTLAIALVPAHARIGAWTFGIVIALRLLGGVFLGGQYSAAIPLALEWSAPRARGWVSGAIMSMSPCANASIALLTLGLYALLGTERYAAWGWRVIFVVGAALALVLLVFYARRVRDMRPPDPCPRRAGAHNGLLSPVHRHRFLGVFVLMSGLWIMTNMAVVVLTTALRSHAALATQAVTWTMFCATAASAPAMLALGHISTFLGRRRFFVGFGALATLVAPAVYLAIFNANSLPAIIALACLLQCVTVAGYGPVGAHLAEQFSADARSSGYGLGYSASIVAPALYPYYLPPLQAALGSALAVALLLAVGGVLVVTGGLLARDALMAQATPSARRFPGTSHASRRTAAACPLYSHMPPGYRDHA